MLDLWAIIFCITHLPWWLKQQRIHLQFRRPKFDPWVGKIPWKREWQPTLVFLLGKSHEDRGAWRATKSWTRLSDWEGKGEDIIAIVSVHLFNKYLLRWKEIVPEKGILWWLNFYLVVFYLKKLKKIGKILKFFQSLL